MQNSIRRGVFLPGFLFSIWIPVSTAFGKPAASDQPPIFREATFADLAKIEVTVASQRLEKTPDAPGTVTAYSAEDIDRFGCLTLRELAEFTPGYSTRISSDEKQNWSLETRGGTATLNEKHLVRIDDIPVNHARNGRASINEELPLFFVERAEFLRGPASSLYGIGAFNGVINLIPKTRSENGTSVETRFSLGSQILRDSLNGFGNYNEDGALVANRKASANIMNKSDRQEIKLSLGLYAKAPDLIRYGLRGGPDRNQRNAVFGRLSEKVDAGSLGEVTLGLIYMETDHGYGTSWAGKSQPPNFQRWTTAIPYLKHDIEFTDKAGLESYVKYNESREQGLQTNQEGWWTGGVAGRTGVFDFNALTVNWEGYSKFTYDFTEKASLLAGVDYDVRWQDRPSTFVNQSDEPKPFLRQYDKKAHTYSAFAQARDELDVLKGLILTAGIRSDNGYLDHNTYHQLSPRVAAVQKITDELNAKLMYGTAFRAPGQDNVSHNREKQILFDIYNDTNTIRQTLSVGGLKAEVIRTFEGNLVFATGNLYLSGTGFYNIIYDQLQRGYFTRADATQRKLIELSDYWLNINGEQTSYGTELETQFLVRKNLRLWINGSYTRAMDQNNASIPDIPPVKFNLGVNYAFPFGLNVFSAMKALPAYTRPSASSPDSTIRGFTVIDMNLVQKITGNVVAELSLSNLLDSDFPQPISEAFPGRTLTASIRTRY